LVPWKFKDPVPQNFWSNKDNRKRFLEWLGKRLGFNQQEDWYKITSEDIITNGGKTLLINFNGSPSKVVQAVFPDYQWMPFRFGTVPKRYSSSMQELDFLNILKWLERELHIR
jgi:hypothetical protein